MSDEELLKRKILEFELELKKNHIDYGLPVVEVIEGDVVFCKDLATLKAYKNLAKTLKKKIITSIVTMTCLLAAIVICKISSLTADTSLYILSAILITGLGVWLYIHHKEKNSYDSFSGKIIVFNKVHQDD